MNDLTKAYAAVALGCTIGFSIVGAFHATVAHLNRATRDQCRTQDWPVHQHAAHMEFCRAYLGTRPY